MGEGKKGRVESVETEAAGMGGGEDLLLEKRFQRAFNGVGEETGGTDELVDKEILAGIGKENREDLFGGGGEVHWGYYTIRLYRDQTHPFNPPPTPPLTSRGEESDKL